MQIDLLDIELPEAGLPNADPRSVSDALDLSSDTLDLYLALTRVPGEKGS